MKKKTKKRVKGFNAPMNVQLLLDKKDGIACKRLNYLNIIEKKNDEKSYKNNK